GCLQRGVLRLAAAVPAGTVPDAGARGRPGLLLQLRPLAGGRRRPGDELRLPAQGRLRPHRGPDLPGLPRRHGAGVVHSRNPGPPPARVARPNEHQREAPFMPAPTAVVTRILAGRQRVPASESMLVAVSGIDASGKGYVTALLVEELKRQGLNAAGIGADGWLNL